MRDQVTRNILDEEECFEIIRKKLRQDSMNDYFVVGYEIVPIDKVHGYMGQYFTLKATVACSESPLDTRNINFFTKIPPPAGSPIYNFMLEYGCFKKEVKLYTTVFPEVLDGLEQKCIPECFLGLEDDVIVLEDMAHSGFVMIDKFVPFDYEHCEVVMKMLAKFHARSLIFEELYKRSIHEEFSQCVEETLWPTGAISNQMFDAATKGVISMIDLLVDLKTEEKRALQKKVVELAADHIEKLLPSMKFRNVICHGDLWANNILFKYDENEKPLKCCFVDFQLVRYNPPAHDIMCFLQFTTTRELREKHSSTLFKIYYESMKAALKEANLDISIVLPWEEFLESIEELHTMLIMHGVLNIPIMLLDTNMVGKYFTKETSVLHSILYEDRTPLVCGQFKDAAKYRIRMQEALHELYDRVIG